MTVTSWLVSNQSNSLNDTFTLSLTQRLNMKLTYFKLCTLSICRFMYNTNQYTPKLSLKYNNRLIPPQLTLISGYQRKYECDMRPQLPGCPRVIIGVKTLWARLGGFPLYVATKF